MARQPPSLTSHVLVTVLIFAVGGVVTFAFGVPLYLRAKASQDWPTVDGTITLSEVKETSDKGKRKYSAAVEYSYSVDRITHTSNLVWPSGGYYSTNRADHQAIVDRYPVGATVKVFYDPQQTSYAILEPGITNTNRLVVILGAVMLLAGVIMGFVTRARLLSMRGSRDHEVAAP